ncbi:MAG: right-handed parallel beta-helix repeat-containing protein, partial [Nitrososphaerales archaeon]
TVGSAPTGLAVNPTTNLVYVANSGDGTVTVIDGATNTVDPVTPAIPVGYNPTGVAVDPATNLVYVANNDGTVSVIYGDPASPTFNTVITTLSIANGAIDSLDAVNPSTNILYVAYYDGSLITAEPLGEINVSVSCGDTITENAILGADIGPCAGNGLVIGANGITLDCAGYTISAGASSTSNGIDLEGYTGVTVENCNVIGFYEGFYLGASPSNTLTGNTADSNHDGFRLDYSSSNNILTGNTANDNGFDGFNIVDSYSNILTGNTANDNGYDGFATWDSYSNTLTGNTADSNNYAGFHLYDYSSNTIGGNTLSENTADDSTYYGYLDNSVGSGTSGTNNTYSTDECSGNGNDSSPAGLCSTSPPSIPALPFPFAIPVVLAATALIYLVMRRRLLGGQTIPIQRQIQPKLSQR